MEKGRFSLSGVLSNKNPFAFTLFMAIMTACHQKELYYPGMTALVFYPNEECFFAILDKKLYRLSLDSYTYIHSPETYRGMCDALESILSVNGIKSMEQKPVPFQCETLGSGGDRTMSLYKTANGGMVIGLGGVVAE